MRFTRSVSSTGLAAVGLSLVLTPRRRGRRPDGDPHGPCPNQNAAILDRIPAGSYDVRVEGDGIVIEVKKGVQLFASRDANLRTVVRPGAGVHVVEYATGGLSREEVAARLGRLEAAAAALRKDVEQLAAAAAKPAGN